VQNIQALTKENEGLKNTVKNKEEMIQKQKNYQVIEKKNYKEELDRAIERSRSESKELLDSKDSTIGTKDEVILVLKDLLDAKDEKIKSLKSKINRIHATVPLTGQVLGVFFLRGCFSLKNRT
jgi:hypothetical protein